MLLYKYIPLTWENNLSDDQKKLFKDRCDCIRDNKFWFSKPNQLNDPYDCRAYFIISKSLEDIKAILDEMEPDELSWAMQKFPNCKSKNDIYRLFKNILNTSKTSTSTKDLTIWSLQAMVSKLVQAKIANVGVLSLTTDSKNLIMWANYANNHRGVCLEIDIPKETHSLDIVRYTNQQPTFKVYEIMTEKYGRFLDLFYTKSKHWSSEEEWRMVARQGNQSKEIPKTKINRILWGCNVTDQTKDKVIELIGKEIPTSQMKLKRNYELHYGTSSTLT